MEVAIPERLRTREGGRNGREKRGDGHADRTGGGNRAYDCQDSPWPRPSEGGKIHVRYMRGEGKVIAWRRSTLGAKVKQESVKWGADNLKRKEIESVRRCPESR